MRGQERVAIQRPFFWTTVGVAHCSAFWQWLGLSGKRMNSCRTSDVVLTVLEAQLGMSSFILNQDMWDPGERFRSLEVVVARAVAESHLVDSMRCAIEAGRVGASQVLAGYP